MKSILFVISTIFLVGCAQQKTALQSPQVQNHRYTTVYEGNKIITYQKQEAVVDTIVEPTTVEMSTEDVALNVPKPRHLINLPMLTKRAKHVNEEARFASKIKLSLVEGFKQSSKNQTNSAKAQEGNLGLGFAGFVLVLGSFLLLIVGTLLFVTFFQEASLVGAVFFAFVLYLLAIAAFVTGIVLSIIGISKRKSQTDFVFGIIGVSLVGLLLLLIILSTVLGV